MSTTVIENAHVVTMDGGRTEYAGGHLVLENDR
ncbi:MAG: hypothetical protein QOD04_6565, partial [Pseudonocardiales bacterium]|nr:hypothetical protein [Pseudonocardiales bacterium]